MVSADLTLSLKDSHDLAREVLKETDVVKQNKVDIWHFMAYKAASLSLIQTKPKLASYAINKALYYLKLKGGGNES